MSWFTRLSTRGRTLVVGGATSAVLLTAAVAIPIPYVAISPGVTYNVLGSVGDTQVISFTGDDVPAGADAARSGEGTLYMTTISISDGITLFAVPRDAAKLDIRPERLADSSIAARDCNCPITSSNWFSLRLPTRNVTASAAAGRPI